MKFFYGIVLIPLFLFPCAQCPEVIDLFLKNYSRPFTLLEVEPGPQAVSCDIAGRYDCSCIVTEHDYYKNLLEYCTAQALDHLVLLGRKIGGPGYRILADCEHFDVVIIRSPEQHFNDHFDNDWNSLLLLAEHTFVGVSDDAPDYFVRLCNYLHEKAILFEDRGQESGLRWIYVYRLKERQHRKIWQSDYRTDAAYTIKSSFEKKEMVHALKHRIFDWIPGINLCTYITLQGVYPSLDWVRKKITEFKNTPHNDFWIGNMIIQGLALKLIDFGDLRRNANFKKQYKKTLDSLKNLPVVPTQ